MCGFKDNCAADLQGGIRVVYTDVGVGEQRHHAK